MTKYNQQNVLVKNLRVEGSFREDQGNIDELRDSIVAKGLLQPLTVSKDGRVLAGRRRLAAAQAAGLETVPVLIVDTINELDEREIELFENLHRKDLTWQERMRLTVRIHDLMRDTHGNNWSQSKTAKLLGRDPADITRAVEMERAMREVPELAEARTADAARKALKRLVEDAIIEEAMEDTEDEVNEALKWASDHYIVADALTEMSKIGGEIADIAEVDPPYGIRLDEHQAGAASYNEIKDIEYPAFLRQTAKHVYRALRPNSWCIWWFGPTWHHVVMKILTETGFKVDDIPAIWHKQDTASQSGNPNIYLNRGYEPFFVCRKGSPILRRRGRSNVFSYPSPRGDRNHPCERPVELMQDLLSTFCFPGARVISPFLGSGNTLIAAYSLGLTGWGYELSDEYKKSFMYHVNELGEPTGLPEIEEEDEDEG